MTDEGIQAKSRDISDKLLNEVSWESLHNVHLYRSVVSLKEVSTKPIIENLREKWPQIKLALASTSRNKPMPAGKFDLIIVPALGFDKDNYRLGWGGGWYDRFLAQQPQALKIGLCFQNGFIKEGLPHESHDIPLDKIITEV